VGKRGIQPSASRGCDRFARAWLFALTLIGPAGLGSAGSVVHAAEWSAAGAPEAFRARVLSIGDGDTIRVLRGDQRITVRLACIDAPEMAQSPWGVQSRRYLAQRLPLGSWVNIRPQALDRYGRTVAEVIGELNLNLVMVEDGQAFAYRRYLAQCDAAAYLEAEFRASRHRYGVWQQSGGIERPWLFRRAQHSGERSRCRQDGACGFSLPEGDDAW